MELPGSKRRYREDKYLNAKASKFASIVSVKKSSVSDILAEAEAAIA